MHVEVQKWERGAVNRLKCNIGNIQIIEQKSLSLSYNSENTLSKKKYQTLSNTPDANQLTTIPNTNHAIYHHLQPALN